MPNTNPFPGMNPWLEAHWGDVHTSLTTYARDQLQAQLPDGLRARVEEYVSVESSDDDDEQSRRFAPDVRVIESHDALEAVGGTAVAVEEEPLLVQRLSDPETLHSIEILDLHDNERIVTSIEFVSLANKSSEKGRQQFIDKRERMLAAGVNIVEIDLLRAGGWVTALSPSLTPRSYLGPYRICVVRAVRDDLAEIYRANFRSPLPIVKIPLREKDDDVKLQLQPLVDAAYVNGRYGADLNYGDPPDPELIGPDAEWADQRLREVGLR